MQKTIARINLKALRENARYFREQTGAKLCAVVKANAYGHGAEEIVSALTGIADAFAVAIIDEAIAIKPVACGQEILVFSPPTDEREALSLIVEGFTACVADYHSAILLVRQATRLKKRVNVHLKINTGMNRYGMGKSQLQKVCRLLSEQPYVRVSGVFSHLYTTQRKQAEEQREAFLELSKVCLKYFPSATRHLSATYGSLLGERFTFDMVRVGIGLYGYLPCRKTLLKNSIFRKGLSILSLCCKKQLRNRSFEDRKYC